MFSLIKTSQEKNCFFDWVLWNKSEIFDKTIIDKSGAKMWVF